MMKRKLKFIVIAIGAVTVFCTILGFYSNFWMIGPGLPASINGWYFPQPTGDYSHGTQMFTETGTEHYGMSGSINRICPQLFPALSRDCIQAQYERFYANDSKMGAQYIVISWYFNDTDDFSNAEQDLYNFLERSGDVKNIDLDVKPELQRLSAILPEQRAHYTFTSVPVTQYTSDSTSGYFISYKRPLLRDRQDYIIMYYGVLDDSDIRTHTPFLTTLLIRGGFPQDPAVISRLQENG
jgi:hypothetical protein